MIINDFGTETTTYTRVYVACFKMYYKTEIILYSTYFTCQLFHCLDQEEGRFELDKRHIHSTSAICITDQR